MESALFHIVYLFNLIRKELLLSCMQASLFRPGLSAKESHQIV